MAIYDQFINLITKNIAPTIIEKGYLEIGLLNYQKDLGEIKLIVQFVPSITITSEEMEFNITASVYLPKLYELVTNKQAPILPNSLEYNDFLYKDIFDLKQETVQSPYRVNEMYIDFDLLVETVIEDLQLYISPYLDNFTCISNIIEEAIKSKRIVDHYYGGILLVQQGNIEEGKKLINAYYKVHKRDFDRLELDSNKNALDQIEMVCDKLKISKK